MQKGFHEKKNAATLKTEATKIDFFLKLTFRLMAVMMSLLLFWLAEVPLALSAAILAVDFVFVAVCVFTFPSFFASSSHASCYNYKADERERFRDVSSQK